MIKKKIKIIFAAGIHSGGGLFIFNYLKQKMISIEDIIYIDERLKNTKFLRKSRLICVKKNIFSKVYNEIKALRSNIVNSDEIIFLNGLPPFLGSSKKVTVYFQNANILKDETSIHHLFSLDFLRSLKFLLFRGNVNKWIVFSKHAKKILSKYVNINRIYLKKINLKLTNKKQYKKVYDFIYPASGEDHKNHKKLIDAFIHLSKKKHFPKLLITLNKSDYKKLNILHYKKKYKLRIFNKPNKNRKIFLKNYNRSRALIYPSTSETLGLPLLEAKEMGLDILVSNKEFAKNYASKKYVFNPYKTESIVKIILKYLYN